MGVVMEVKMGVTAKSIKVIYQQRIKPILEVKEKKERIAILTKMQPEFQVEIDLHLIMVNNVLLPSLFCVVLVYLLVLNVYVDNLH